MVKKILLSIAQCAGSVWNRSSGRYPNRDDMTSYPFWASLAGSGMKKTSFAGLNAGQQPTTYSRSTDYSLTIQGQSFGYAWLGLSLLLTLGVGSRLTAQCQLECNNAVQVSLNPLGQAPITPQMILAANTTGCNGGFTVEVQDSAGNLLGDVLDCNYAGQTLSVQLTHTASGNQCTGSVILQDYLAPTITCQNKYIRCNEDTSPQAVGYPPVSDNCTVFSPAMMSYTDNYVDLGCYTVVNGNTVTARIERTWSVTDASGNSAGCTQTIWLKRVTLADVVFPLNRDGFEAPALQCGDNPNDFAVTGYPSVNGVPLNNNGACELVVNYTDQTAPLCGGSYQILREWRVTDWCANTFSIDVQVIKVQDIQAPVITCTANLTLGTSTIACTRTVVLPQATATDNCSSLTILPQWSFGTGFGPFNNVPVGNYTVTYRATDACNNSSSCTMQVAVVDDVPPFAICDEFTDVNLTSPGGNSVWAFSFDDGSWDNCAVDHFGVSRDGVDFDEIIHFDCNDAGDTVMIQFRVWDAGGLYNTCMVQVFVNDKVNPTVSCPTPVTIHCADNQSNTALTGTATGTDNCGAVNITYTDASNLSACNEGTVVRTWRATDAAGNSVTCLQTIVKQDQTPLVFTFPADTTLYTCGAVTTTAALGSPIVSGQDCENINISHTDQLFNIAAPACYKIFRTWTVVEWCDFNPDNPTAGGYWTHLQVINVMDTVAPVISCPANNVFSITGTSCETIVTLNAATALDCNTNVQITNNSIYATSGGANASGTYPKGTYQVTFTASDGCGNTASCVTHFNVVDARAPQAICNNGLSISLDASGSVQVTSGMVAAPSTSDNCTPFQQLSLVVEPSQFTCSDMGTNMVQLTVTDQSGNSNFCTTNIVIQDNLNFCSGATGTAAGIITTEDNTPVEGATVNLMGGDVWEVGTESNGSFLFSNVPPGNYTVQPSIDENYLNGVTTYDIVLIRKHILGFELLDSPYKIIAADVNRSGSITAYDLVIMRQLILQIIDAYPGNQSWCFIDHDYAFPSPENPFSSVFPETIQLNNFSGDLNGIQFTGVKIGDVNLSADAANAGTRSEQNAGEVSIVLPGKSLLAGEEAMIPVQAKDFNDIIGCQFALKWNPEWIEVTDVVPALSIGIDESHFGMKHLDKGTLVFSWDQPESKGVSWNENETLFYLKLKARSMLELEQQIAISPDVMLPEAYSSDDIHLKVVLSVENEMPTNAYTLLGNTPNPFSDKTTIGFNAPESTEGEFCLVDALGIKRIQFQRKFDKGINYIALDRGDILLAGGVYFYSIHFSDNQILTGKMICN